MHLHDRLGRHDRQKRRTCRHACTAVGENAGDNAGFRSDDDDPAARFGFRNLLLKDRQVAISLLRLGKLAKRMLRYLVLQSQKLPLQGTELRCRLCSLED